MNELGYFYSSIQEILIQVYQNSFTAINFAMIEVYWKIGRRIIKQEQYLDKSYTAGSYLAKSYTFLSVYHSYAEKEPVA